MVSQLRHKLGKLHKDAEDDADEIIGSLTLAELAAIAGIDAELANVAADGGQQFLLQINVPGRDELFDKVNDRAVAYARARGGELVSGLEESTREELGGIIADGLEENIGLDGIIDRLQNAYAFSEDRADLIARTEVAMANGNGSLEGMRLARAAGVKLKKLWLPDAEACDECLENGDAGPIDLEDVFPTGDDAPPAHPNCQCDMASEVEEGEAGEEPEEDE